VEVLTVDLEKIWPRHVSPASGQRLLDWLDQIDF
jgi:hypothetical protein